MRRLRKPTGISMIVVALFAAFFILLPLGIFGFELLRFSVTQMQLRSICDASALSGAVGVASTKTGWTPMMAQDEGMKAAFITFQQNVLIGTWLKGISTAHFNDGAALPDPPPEKCIVSYTLLDQNFNPVPTGDPAAKLMRCEAVYGYVPPIGQVLGFTNVPVRAFAEGGLPSLDIVLCYDVSGSMDDQTPVSFVRRFYNTATSRNVCQVVSVNRSIVGAPVPKSAIYNIQYPPKEGTSVNALAPQNLNNASAGPIYTSGNQYPYTWSPDLRCAPSAASEIGQPPGNLTDPAISDGTGTAPPTFTDLVVNLDGKDVFAGMTDVVSGLKFPDVETLVEAARGNLNSAATMASACPNNTFAARGVTPNPLYQSTYQTLATAAVQPMATAKTAAGNFYNTMNISANCHFGFVSFSTGVGTDETSTWESLASTTPNRIDRSYPRGGTSSYPLPVVKLVKTDATTNYTNCRNAVSSLVATGQTDIADSLNEAISQLTVTNGLTRDKARRAIVLFTDGIPNVPGGSAGGTASPAANAAYAAADVAASGGIQIYAIGLSQNGAITPTMQTILQKITDKTGGQTFLVNRPADLDEAFQKIAKALIVLR